MRTSSEIKFAGNGANVVYAGGKAWVDTNNIVADDDTDSYVRFDGSGVSNYLRSYNHGFAIPSNVAIEGIKVSLKRKADTNGGVSNFIRDNHVYLTKNGTTSIGDDKLYSSNWNLTYDTIEYGSSSDLWGTTWTPSEINSGDFGFMLQTEAPYVGALINVFGYVDYIKIEVTYSYTTSNIKLSYYNSSSSSVTVYNYIDDVSGSTTLQNNGILDLFAGNTSSSLVGLSASIINLSGSVVVGSALQITSGSSKVLASASSLAHSDYGKRTFAICLNTSASLIGGETGFIRIPSTMNGWKLIDAQASCAGSSLSGSAVFTVDRINSVSSSSTSMMTTSITIDEGKYDSENSSIPSVINTTNSTVLTGYKVKASNVISGSGVTYAQISLTFQNLP